MSKLCVLFIQPPSLSRMKTGVSGKFGVIGDVGDNCHKYSHTICVGWEGELDDDKDFWCSCCTDV